MEFIISSNLNIENLKTEFKENKFVSIKNFLEIESAEKIYNFLNTMNETWWSNSTNILEDKVEYRLLPENKQIINLRKQLVSSGFGEDKFTYSFDRTCDNHFVNCDCMECKYRLFIKSNTYINFISQITGDTDLTPGTFFCSNYKSGDFLYPHTDGVEKRKISLVYNLSKNWKPWYGGNLVILTDWETNDVKRLVIPSFNTLNIMKVENKINPHYVSHVSPNVKNKRLAITWWFE